MNISIVSSSTRTGRISHRIALALAAAIKEKGHSADIIDLAEENLAPFEERFSILENPSKSLIRLHEKLLASEAFIFLTPEYNGAIASGLKNFIDLFAKEPFQNKAIGVATGSTGAMGGVRAAYQLQQNILTINAFPHPRMLMVGKMDQVLSETGDVLDEKYGRSQDGFLTAFLDFAQRLSS